MGIRQLPDYCSSLRNDYTKHCDIEESRLNFIHTESMGFAYKLSPFHGDSMDMVGTDRIDTITQQREYRYFAIPNSYMLNVTFLTIVT